MDQPREPDQDLYHRNQSSHPAAAAFSDWAAGNASRANRLGIAKCGPDFSDFRKAEPQLLSYVNGQQLTEPALDANDRHPDLAKHLRRCRVASSGYGVKFRGIIRPAAFAESSYGFPEKGHDVDYQRHD